MTPTVAILYAPGTNCHEETAAALERAGLASELLLLRDLLAGQARLDRYWAAVVPGGFSYGDHLGAGRIFATILISQLKDQLAAFLEAGKPLLGVCNGFQVLTEAGILPGKTLDERALALVENESARFEDRVVRLAVCDEPSPWTAGLSGRALEIPSAHAEGRALWRGPALGGGARVVFRYCNSAGAPTAEYPHNPSGAPEAVAGITDATGLVLGLMPHPERASLEVHASQDGLEIFRNLASWFRTS